MSDITYKPPPVNSAQEESLVSKIKQKCGHDLQTPQRLLNADLCLTPRPGKPADKPSQLRPLCILRPDAKELASTAKELLEPLTPPYKEPL